jgi:two-component system, OmpR family, sensor kinase
MRASIRMRVIAAMLVVALVGAAGLSFYFLREIEAYGQRRLEERLGTQARVTAALVGAAYERSGSTRPLAPNRPFALSEALRNAYPTQGTSLRIIDAGGSVVADSSSKKVGYSLSDLEEVERALAGVPSTADRTERGGRHATFVAAPIVAKGAVVGVAYVASSTFSIATLLRDYRLELLVVVGLYVLGALILAELLSRWLTRPLGALERATAAFARGDHAARVEPAGPRETRALAVAFNSMADEVSRVVGELRSEERRKSRFVSDVSHELRTPLTAIRGAAETMLEDEDIPAEDRDRFLATIVSESDRLGRIANDLLALERIEGATGELPVVRVDLYSVALHTTSTLEPLLEERGVAVEVTGEPAFVLGDRDRLQQVLANLVDNASRMTPRGGTVRVSVTRTAHRVTVAVADEGPGIPADDVDRVFDRFWRAQASRDRGSGGAGLGLSIVRAIVERHGGHISAANRPGGGAVFSFDLPSAG